MASLVGMGYPSGSEEQKRPCDGPCDGSCDGSDRGVMRVMRVMDIYHQRPTRPSLYNLREVNFFFTNVPPRWGITRSDLRSRRWASDGIYPSHASHASHPGQSHHTSHHTGHHTAWIGPPIVTRCDRGAEISGLAAAIASGRPGTHPRSVLRPRRARLSHPHMRSQAHRP